MQAIMDMWQTDTVHRNLTHPERWGDVGLSLRQHSRVTGSKLEPPIGFRFRSPSLSWSGRCFHLCTSPYLFAFVLLSLSLSLSLSLRSWPSSHFERRLCMSTRWFRITSTSKGGGEEDDADDLHQCSS